MSASSQIQFLTSLSKANQGDPIEQYMVGIFYKKGIGVSVDNGKAQEFSSLVLAKLQEIRKAAELGNI
jgi:TPR repeat protein